MRQGTQHVRVRSWCNHVDMLLWTFGTQCRLVQGWDKTYCLQFVEKEYDEIHFFGDKTFEVRPPWASKCVCISVAAGQTVENSTPCGMLLSVVRCALPRMLQVSAETATCS